MQKNDHFPKTGKQGIIAKLFYEAEEWNKMSQDMSGREKSIYTLFFITIHSTSQDKL